MAFDWRPLMGKITAAFRQELGENLTGIYLHGSAAFGSMSEGSDLDFIAVTERPPTQEQKEHLIAALLQLEREAPAKGLEMSVVLLRDCRDFAYPTPYRLHYSPIHRRAFEQDLSGYCRRMQGVDYDLAAHFTVIRRVGIVLFGSPVREVFGPVPFADYLDSICRDVAGAAQDILHTPLDTALNLCRVLAAAKEGLVLSKAQGAQWGLRHLQGQYRPLLMRAASCYEQGAVLAWDCGELEDFARDVLDQIHGRLLKMQPGRVYNKEKEHRTKEEARMEMMFGERWCKVEIYNEYLKKIPSLLSQINTVEKMQRKAETELQMLQKEPDSFSRQQYQARLESTREQCAQRLGEMKEELNLILGLKEQLEEELHLRAGEIEQ